MKVSELLDVLKHQSPDSLVLYFDASNVGDWCEAKEVRQIKVVRKELTDTPQLSWLEDSEEPDAIPAIALV